MYLTNFNLWQVNLVSYSLIHFLTENDNFFYNTSNVKKFLTLNLKKEISDEFLFTFHIGPSFYICGDPSMLKNIKCYVLNTTRKIILKLIFNLLFYLFYQRRMYMWIYLEFSGLYSVDYKRNLRLLLYILN